MSHDKTHFAVCVKGYRPSMETLNAPPLPPSKKNTALAALTKTKSVPLEVDNSTFDSAFIVYKLPFVKHGDPNPEKNTDVRKPTIQGNTAIVEADVEVTVPKRGEKARFFKVYRRPTLELHM